MPFEQIDLNSSSPITFSHPQIPEQLVIGTGVSGISWSYNLNVVPTSTYGGEVVQVLSAYVDALTVHGQTSDNRQLRQIADWFLRYMQLAGLYNRDEHFITMEYPERGWSFWLQVTTLPDFVYDIEQIAVEWSVTAEVVADNDLNYLSQMTMTGYTESAFDPSMWDMKFREGDPRNDPITLDPALGIQIGDNFASLLGAWATGDFAHFAANPTSTIAQNNLKPAKEYWTQLYGDTAVAGDSPGGASGASAAALGSAAGSSPVQDIVNAFTAQGIPPEMGVASAMQESGLNPDEYQLPIGPPPYHGGPPVVGQVGVGLFQTTNVSGPEMVMAKAAIDHFPQNITKYYPAANQAQFAAARFAAATRSTDLGQWAYNAQRPADEAAYVAAVNSNIPRAKQLIQQAASAAGAIGASGSPKARSAAQWALTQLGVKYVYGSESPGVGFDCSGLCQWAYAKAGVAIPRTTYTQVAFCKQVPLSDIVVGDLVFCTFGSEKPPGHVVMYIGNGQVVAAPETGEVVFRDALTNYTAAGVFFSVGRVVS